MSTLYAAFSDASAAERAAGALLDNGAIQSDISVLANEGFSSTRAVIANQNATDAEVSAKTGISTTTPGDVAAGAVKGASIGVGVGAAAIIASLLVPGLGLVLGGGALATALAGGTATILAGAAAGGVVGYLKDQGVSADMATRYNAAFEQGGAILAIAIPTGTLATGEVEHILTKYGAMNVATYNNPTVAPVTGIPDGIPVIPTPAAVVVDPIATAVPASTTHRVIDAETGEETIVTSPAAPVAVAPVVAPVSNVMVDPITGAAVAPGVVDAVTGRPIAMQPVSAVDPVTGLVIDPVPAAAVAPVATGVVIDPVTGLETPATVAQGLAGEAIVPVAEDVVIQNADRTTTVRRNAELL